MKVSVSKIGNMPALKHCEKTNSMSFGGRLKAQRKLTEQIIKNSPWQVRSALKLGMNDGEALNTSVTGIGTAFVAPVFIAFNPLSKEDKQTKAYSAWRQPISAVLAVAAQLFVNDKFNNMMDNLASTGELKEIGVDHKANGYLKRLIKLENPAFLSETPQIPKEAGFFRRLFRIDERQYRNNKLDAEIINRQNQEIRQKVEIARKKLSEQDYDFDKLVTKDYKNIAEEYVKKTYKEDLANMAKSEKKEFLKNKIAEKATSIAKERIEDNAKAKWRLRLYSQQRYNLDDAIAHAQAQLANISKDNPRQIALWQDIIRRLDMTKNYEVAQKMPAFSSLSNLGNTYEEVLKNVKIKQFVLKKLDDSKDLLKNYKKFGGLIVLMATLPVSCGLLNYTYPLIMEKIMPEASKKKKGKELAGNVEGKKCQ